MALQSQKIPLELTTGIDTKTDKFNAVSFRNVENFRFNKPGALHKVPGYTAYNTTLQNLASNMPAITSASSIYSYKNELLMNTPEQMLAYSTALNKWVSKNYFNVNGTTYSSKKRTTSITFVDTSTQAKLENFSRDSNADYYVDSTYQVFTAADPVANSIKIRIDLLDGGTTLLNSFIPTVIGAPPFAKLAGARTTRIIGIYQGFLYVVTYSLSAPDYALYKYDLSLPNSNPTRIAISSSYFNAAYLDSAAGQIYFFGANGTDLYQHRYDIGANTQVGAVGVCPSGYVTSYIDDVSASGVLKISGYSGTTISTANITKMSLGISGSFTTVTAAFTNFTTACDGTNVYYMWLSSATTNSGVYIKALAADNTTNVIGGTYRIAGYCNISSKATYDSGTIYINAFSRQVNLKTNYIAKIKPLTLFEDTNWEIMAKSGFLESTSNANYHRMFKIGTSVYIGQTVLSEDAVGMLFSDANVLKNLELVKHDLNVPNTDSVYENNTLFIPSSVTRSYDGANIVEHAFLDSPEASAATDVSPNTFENGVYGIAVIYTWIDNNGLKYRSAPYFTSVTIGSPNLEIDLVVNCLGLTLKDNVTIEAYLTLANQTTYYKFRTIANVQNDSTAAMVLSRGAFTAAQQAEQEVLYTTGGVLENDAPEPALASTTFKNRVWLAGTSQIQYSKLININEAVEFNGQLTILPDNSYGPITGIQGMDNVMAIFTTENILIQSGEGPNNLGQLDDYGSPQLISSDVGCSEPRSIVATPEGIMFKSEKGIYILNRGLYVSYIGAAVEDYNSETIIGAQLLNNTNEVRFQTATKILSYDYLLKQWSVFTNINATVVDCTMHANNFHYLKSNGVVHKNDDSLFTNVGSYYAGKLETAWITVAGIQSAGAMSRSQQGFQRLYNINMLGQYKSAHNVTVGIAYNYDDTIIDTATIVPTGVGIYQFEVPPSIQKCEAFKLYIQDTNQAGTGESLVLSNILLEVGIKGTAQKVTPDGNRFPTS